jgi:ArsR family transcriptional regulator
MGAPRRTSADSQVSDDQLVRALKALADPTRFRMVQEIAQAGELSCSEVTDCFNLSQPTISHHLKILFEAGLLVQRAEGKHHYTSVNRALVDSIATLLPRRLSASAKRSST